MVQRKPIACKIYGIDERLRGFTVRGESGIGHVDTMAIAVHSCQSIIEFSYILPGGFLLLFTWPV